MFQIVLAKPAASAGLLNPTSAPSPPRLIVTIFPFAWHFRISDAMKEQLARFVPGNVPVLVLLHIYKK